MFFGGNFFFILFFISFLNWWIPYFSYVFFLSLKYKNENCWYFIIASNFNGMNKLVEENFTQKKRVEFCPIFIWSLYSNPSQPVPKMWNYSNKIYSHAHLSQLQPKKEKNQDGLSNFVKVYSLCFWKCLLLPIW